MGLWAPMVLSYGPPWAHGAPKTCENMGKHAKTGENMRTHANYPLLGFLLYFVHILIHIRPCITPYKSCSAAVLGCSSARGWIQLILLVILAAGGLILKTWRWYFAVFVDERMSMV